ncbi:hypothetical protein [Streptomyces lavendulocolor]|uniref:hypothetical protein n=1 Tax=Streptomyces lavendulocolor TaxID=67316 RepID=UPI003C2E230F
MRATARRTRDTSWIDKDNQFIDAFSRSRGLREPANSNAELRRLREWLNEPVFAHRSSVRACRVVIYVRTLPAQNPSLIFTTLRTEATQRGWHVGHELHDAIGQAAPQQCPQWLQARKFMHEGFADGVLVKDRNHISSYDDEYRYELHFVAERQCFTALLVPEAAP